MKTLGINPNEFHFNDSSHDQLVKKINNTHPILSFSKFSTRILNTSTNTISFSWGGGLVGAMGFTIYQNGEPIKSGEYNDGFDYITLSTNVGLEFHKF
jgi:hypothetical protein